ncbi:hypothetical protein Vi05172_g5489 [Venturia inaequalis]|nr:hypothetical protein Vi05172_g5489 [Venturia inaequalis]
MRTNSALPGSWYLRQTLVSRSSSLPDLITTHQPPGTCTNGQAEDSIEELRRRIIELQNQLHLHTVSRNSRDPESNLLDFEQQSAEKDNRPTRQSSPPAQQHSSSSSIAPERPEDASIEDAATILEFLAWGRRKDPDLVNVVSPEAERFPAGSGDTYDEPSLVDPELGESQLAFLQLLFPGRRQLETLVNYHIESLIWYHGSFYSPLFRKQLDDFYALRDGLADDKVDFQWVALLFSVLCGSLVCAPSEQIKAWGFREKERETLSRQWYSAVNACLTRAHYTANHSILSCQAIATLTIAAHPLGQSNSHSVMLASSVRIAQSLGLHRLADGNVGSVIEREIGRRVWAQLCVQDWFSIPFSEAYLINPLYSTSSLPQNCHDDDIRRALPDSTPTITSYCRFLTEIAGLMPKLQDAMAESNTLFTKYQAVMKYDKKMRALAQSTRPVFLANVPIQPNWPKYVPWARRAIAISSSHKIIMIHRKFLGASFTNHVFAFTRRCCLAASRTIINESKHVAIEQGPILWIYHAFVVAASIIVCLDLLHRDANDPEFAAQRKLVEDGLQVLRILQPSMIAKRGEGLILALLKAAIRASQDTDSCRKRKAGNSGSSSDPPDRKRRRGFDVQGFVKSYCGDASPKRLSKRRDGDQGSLDTDHNRLPETLTNPFPDDSSFTENMLGTSLQNFPLGDNDLFVGSLYDQLDEENSFENLLFLANYDLNAFPI